MSIPQAKRGVAMVNSSETAVNSPAEAGRQQAVAVGVPKRGPEFNFVPNSAPSGISTG
jgi:hypothetical protein